MKQGKKLTALLLSLLLVLGLTACTGRTKTTSPSPSPSESAEPSEAALPADVQAIVDRGVLRVGVKEDVPGFGLRNTSTGEIEGFEIDLAKAIAKEILGDESKVEFTAVTAKTRGPLLDNGELDLVIATFTITEERKQSYNFSTPYYTDAVGLLVKKDAGYTSLADMNDAVIGVAQSATSKDAVSAEAQNLGITVSFSEFPTYPEIKAALDSGRVNAFCVDRLILRGYLDDSCVLLDDQFNPQNYGVCSKLDNTGLAETVDNLVTGWLSDGTIAGMISDWSL